MVFIAGRHAVNHDAIELTGLHVLLLHIEVAVGDAAIEDAFGYLQFRALLLYRDKQLGHLLVGYRAYLVLEYEAHAGGDHCKDDERPEGLHQRDSRSLDGRELTALAQVAKSDKRRKQQCQRKRLGYEHQAHIPEQLTHNVESQTLAYQFVYKLPQKLHHQNKEADAERTAEEQAELPEDEYI